MLPIVNNKHNKMSEKKRHHLNESSDSDNKKSKGKRGTMSVGEAKDVHRGRISMDGVKDVKRKRKGVIKGTGTTSSSTVTNRKKMKVSDSEDITDPIVLADDNDTEAITDSIALAHSHGNIADPIALTDSRSNITNSIEEHIKGVEAEIKSVELEITKAQTKIEESEGTVKEFWMTEKLELRKKETELRKEKNILLQRQPVETSMNAFQIVVCLLLSVCLYHFITLYISFS